MNLATSQTHRKNADTIDSLEETERINSSSAVLLHWTNNLEEIAAEIVSSSANNETEELEFAFSVACDYQKRMIRHYVNTEKIIVEFAISRYNAILRKAKINEQYMLGGQS